VHHYHCNDEVVAVFVVLRIDHQPSIVVVADAATVGVVVIAVVAVVVPQLRRLMLELLLHLWSFM